MSNGAWDSMSPVGAHGNWAESHNCPRSKNTAIAKPVISAPALTTYAIATPAIAAHAIATHTIVKPVIATPTIHHL